jgi:hypothetical protein
MAFRAHSRFVASLDARISGAADELTRAPEGVGFLQPAQHREALDLKRQYATNGRASCVPLPARFVFVRVRATNVWDLSMLNGSTPSPNHTGVRGTGNESDAQCGRGVPWRAAHRVPNIEMATITSLGSTHRGWSLSLYMRENPIMFLVFASSDREKTQATGESE